MWRELQYLPSLSIFLSPPMESWGEYYHEIHHLSSVILRKVFEYGMVFEMVTGGPQ